MRVPLKGLGRWRDRGCGPYRQALLWRVGIEVGEDVGLWVLRMWKDFLQLFSLGLVPQPRSVGSCWSRGTHDTWVGGERRQPPHGPLQAQGWSEMRQEHDASDGDGHQIIVELQSNREFHCSHDVNSGRLPTAAAVGRSEQGHPCPAPPRRETTRSWLPIYAIWGFIEYRLGIDSALDGNNTLNNSTTLLIPIDGPETPIQHDTHSQPPKAHTETATKEPRTRH